MTIPATDSTEMPVAEFFELLTRSRLLSEERIAVIQAKVHRKATSGDIARQLTSDGELSSFQAKKLLTGLWQGLVVGRFRILKPIGRGGMGVVYLAEDASGKGHRAKVALKILPPRKAAAEPRTRARFLREVSIGRELPAADNIAHVYETGIVDGIAFIAMEYVSGRTVRNVVATNGALTVDVTARVFAGVAHGLAAAHAKGFIHRDVKPSNIMITPDGAAKLVDFGFALRVNESNTDPTVVGGAGYTLGTFDFIPPEQATNANSVTPQADQYSLGCTMYYALAAQPPFPGGSAREKMKRHRWEDPLPLSGLRPDLPAEFTAIVERLMAKLPVDRFASCEAVAKALNPWAKGQAAPQNMFTEDAFESEEDDLDQLASMTPTRPRRSAYRRDSSSTATLAVLITAVLSIIVAAIVYLAKR